MAQYCRYCSFCFDGDGFFCSNMEKPLDDAYIKRVNHCKNFDLSPLGDVITGRQYAPRQKKTKDDKPDEFRQISIFDM